MIKVIETHLYGSQSEEIVSKNLIGFIEKNFKQNRDFTIKSVPKKTDPVQILNPVIGFYSPFGIVYISNPEKKKGIIAIDFSKKILIYNPDESAFYNPTDNAAYIQTSAQYIRETYPQILQEFQDKKYTFHRYAQKDDSESMLHFNSTEELTIDKQLTLEQLL